jgi:spermidine synthase
MGVSVSTISRFLNIVAALVLLLASSQSGFVHGQVVVVHEVRSAFSHIQIRDWGNQRGMFFLGHGGEAALETVIDPRAPHRLQHRYSHTLMAGLLYRPAPSACLLIGLGGGAIVRFLNHELPPMRLDVVEIDPVVVDLAREYFGTVPGGRTRIFTEDAFDYLHHTRERYDLILVNAHLMPGAQTNATGLPLRLAAEAFVTNLRERLLPGGVVAFNLIQGPDTPVNIALVRDTFATVEVYHSAAVANVIVVALAASGGPGEDELRKRAQALDPRDERGFSFERLLDERER